MSAPATRRLTTGGPDGTLRIGEEIGREIWPGAVLLLVGDLGTGKTTLVRGIARGMGVGGHVRSPSFTIVSRYRGATPLTHVDLYRIRSDAEAGAAGVLDLIEPDGVVAVEWADRIEGVWPDDAISIRIRATGPSEREIEVTGPEASVDRLGLTRA